MPGSDVAEWFKVVLGELDVPFVPELPGRGAPSSLIGRTLGMVTDLGADLQPDGWRVGVGQGADQRRARSLLAEDLDRVEEIWADAHAGPLKIQVTGPLTLAASVEHPRGEKMLADPGARRDLADALGAAVERHVADVRRRFGTADVVVQVDEPRIRAVLDAQVPTASGFRRYRSVDAPEADDLLRRVIAPIEAGGATPVVHVCSAEVPVELLRGAGFAAISFDLSLAQDRNGWPEDVWAEAFDAGTDLWVGTTADRDAVNRVLAWFGRFGFGPDAIGERLVVSPPCGLAGSSPEAARQTITRTAELARRLDDRRSD